MLLHDYGAERSLSRLDECPDNALGVLLNKEAKYRLAKGALGAVKTRVDKLLLQKLPQTLNQVQVRQVGRQNHLHQGLIRQPPG